MAEPLSDRTFGILIVPISPPFPVRICLLMLPESEELVSSRGVGIKVCCTVGDKT